MSNPAEPYEVKLLNRLLDFDENLCELIISQGITLFFYKIFWNRYLVDFLLHKWHFSKSDSGAREREREGRPPRCSTSWKKGHHSVNSGPILAILGSKWPQRRDLSFGTVFFNAKMATNGSKCPRKTIRWSRKRKADQKRSFQSKIRVISSHFHIKTRF